MAFEFKISKESDQSYNYNFSLDGSYFLYHNSEHHFNEYSSGRDKLICYGYCFDVRDPKRNTGETLEGMISKDSFFKDIAYLNGQFIMIYIKDGMLYVTSDATSLVPIYVNDDLSIITNDEVEANNKLFNPNLILNLSTNEKQRIIANSTEDKLAESILELVKNQHKYFLTKNIVINFKSNNYTKALLAIMKPALYNNILTVKGNKDYNESLKFAESIAKDFNMNIDNDAQYNNSENIYFARNLLFNYKQFTSKKITNSKNIKNFIIDKDFNNQEVSIKNAEANIINRRRENSMKLNKNGMLYDPFNVHAIYQILIKNSEINVIGKLTQELLPSINYYNFMEQKTVKEINNNLVDKIQDLKNNQIDSKNERFLMKTKTSYFSVSDNLDGEVKDDEIIVYPASQKISNTERFSISYENPGDGMILVKSFYKNKKNGQSIKVTINNHDFTIDELFDGILFNVESKLNVSIKYEKSRNSLPWQKAGTLLIRHK